MDEDTLLQQALAMSMQVRHLGAFPSAVQPRCVPRYTLNVMPYSSLDLNIEPLCGFWAHSVVASHAE